MIDVVSTLDIDAPIEAVSDYASDPKNAPEWHANVADVHVTSPGPICVGFEFDITTVMMGKKSHYHYRVTEFEAHRRFVMTSTSGPFKVKTELGWSRNPDNGTSMSIRTLANPRGFKPITVQAMAAALRQGSLSDLRHIKRVFEEATLST